VDIQQRLLKFVFRSNWILFVAASLFGLFLTPADIAKGIFCGALLVTVNFHFMYRILRKSLTPPHIASHVAVMVRSYIRFVVSGGVIFFLISRHYVHPLGLFIGLSVVIVSILAATLCELKKTTFEEAI
jgi:hypothetical protein